MAVTLTKQSSPLGSNLVRDSTCGDVQENVTGTSGVLYSIEINNEGSQDVYFKLANASSATIGSTAATIVIYVPATKRRSIVFPKGITFSVGFTHWCTTGAAEASTTTASSKPDVYYVTS